MSAHPLLQHQQALLSDGEALVTKALEANASAIAVLDQANRVLRLGVEASDLRLDLIGTRATLDRAVKEFERLRQAAGERQVCG